MYIYCVYPAMSNSSKQLPYCLKKLETRVPLIVFNGVLFNVHTYTVTTVDLHESGTRKTIFWSVSDYNKTIQ